MPNPIDDWLADLAAALDVADLPVPRDALLDIARDAAHNVARPAAPLTTFVLGLAVGRHGTDVAALGETVQRLLAEREPS